MSPNKSSIILVEDSEEIIEILRELIDPQKFEITSYTNSTDAVLALRKQKFDILICDLYMPHLSGMSLLQTCQKHGHLPQTVIVVSGHLMSEDFSQSFLRQFHCLEKPFFIPELLRIISSVKGKAS